MLGCILDPNFVQWPRGLMDKASDFESEDCEFESRRGRKVLIETNAKKVVYQVNTDGDVTMSTIC